MDRKVVVLSPSEWENRVELGELTHQAYQQLHYGLTREQGVQTQLYNLMNRVSHKSDLGVIIEEIKQVIETSKKVAEYMRKSQEYISGVSTVIKYKLKEGE